MTWGDDVAAKLLGSSVPAGYQTCLALWETPVVCELIALADLKAILGVTDDSQDTELTRLIAVYSQAIARFTERQLCEGAREVVFVARSTCAKSIIALPQFPVASIEHFDIDGDVIDPAEILFDGNRGTVISLSGGSWAIGRYLHVKYTAGYSPIPADLENAVVKMIDSALAGGGAGTTTGPVKSQRVEGAVTETYYDPRTSASETTSGSGLVGSYASTLDYYRGERAFV